jgi:hypothetical protein
MVELLDEVPLGSEVARAARQFTTSLYPIARTAAAPRAATRAVEHPADALAAQSWEERTVKRLLFGQMTGGRKVG